MISIPLPFIKQETDVSDPEPRVEVVWPLGSQQGAPVTKIIGR
jgi:hypothetical protein